MAAPAAAVAAAVLALTAAACTHNDQSLKPFTAAEAHFRVSFPTKPKRNDQQVPSSAGSLRLVQYSSTARGGTGYSVGWFELAQAPPDSGVRPFLESTTQGSVAAIKGTLLGTSYLTVDGHPAVEYTARAPKHAYVKSRTVLVGRDVYILEVVSTTKDPPRYAEFVGSFATIR